jgi:hypothetical protein
MRPTPLQGTLSIRLPRETRCSPTRLSTRRRFNLRSGRWIAEIKAWTPKKAAHAAAKPTQKPVVETRFAIDRVTAARITKTVHARSVSRDA